MPHVIDRVEAALEPPSPALLAEALGAAGDIAAHQALAARCLALQALEVMAAPAPKPAGPMLRIAAWNAERCKYGEASLALLDRLAVDVALLTEMDIGMARSGNRNTIREIATGLGAGYVFGTEFVELGLGDDRERLWHAGEANSTGLHGNGIVSRYSFAEPVLVRLDDGGVWFGGSYKQRRLGARNAVAARLEGWTVPLWLVSLHLESHSDAADRARQVARLVDALDRRIGAAPCVIGGDFNTAALPRGEALPEAVFTNPGALEPLFSVLAGAGFGWIGANRRDPTCRTRPDGEPRPPFTRLDWLFVRGVAPVGAMTVAAVDGDGAAVSDHELIAADIHPRGR